MADLKYKEDTALQTLLTTGLNSLANNARAISAAYDNGTALDLWADFELLVQWDSSVSGVSGANAAEIYIVPSVDDTTYAEGSTTVTPQAIHLAGRFESRNPSISATERLVLTGIPLPPRNFKVLLINISGQTYETANNTLKMQPYKLQVA